MLLALPSHPPWYLGKTTSYVVPQYAVLINLTSRHPSSVQIHVFPSAPCYQTLSVYVHTLIPETKFHIHKEPQEELYIYTSRTRPRVAVAQSG
jgi:hypothetical protein